MTYTRALRSEDQAELEYYRRRQRVAGFNSLFATASIDAAKRYYTEFAKQQEALRRAAAPQDRPDLQFRRERGGGRWLPRRGGVRDRRARRSSRDFLEAAIQDYNAMFGTCFDTSADKFQNYYKDLSLRLKNREIDMVIVVNMFLTGFDATTLNTLWVDKNLRQHGLIQAYSRTNRILNSVKTYGNIVSFRDLEEATNDAMALFGNKDARGIVLLKPYGDYYAEYDEKVAATVHALPARRRSSASRAEGVHRPVRRDPAAAEHPDLRSTTSPATRS